MKRTLQILGLAAMLFAQSTTASAQSQLVHYWHFNNLSSSWAFTTPNIPLVKANYSIIDTNKATLYYGAIPGTSSAYTTTLDSYTPSAQVTDTPIINTNSRMSQPAGFSLRVRNPSDSMQLLLYIPSTKYKNLKLKMMIESSSTSSGMQLQQYDYSVDSGATWKTTALSITSDSTYAPTYDSTVVRFNDATDTLVKNNAKLVFRIRFTGHNTGTSGNNRFDNITVDGDTIATVVTGGSGGGVGIQQIANIQEHFSIFPNPATETVWVNTDIAGTKEIAIYSTMGAKLYQAHTTENSVPVAVNNFAAGTYFILVQTEKGIYKSNISVK